ncbi:hypothetical protein DFJ74DRAFT_611529 [Hyaloraphidium curvatum]|nr:hypothetical protein DFJ74DRAFT_611529 [Hyaloraphidium curvatum]
MPCPSACAAPVRHFASSPRIAARKSPVGPRVDSDVEGLTGDPDKDGMNIYQIDFLETAMWTKELLLKMQHHEHLLKGLQQDDVPVDDAAILTFKTTSVYDYDYTKPSPEAANKRVECTFQVSKLVAMQKWSGKQRHKLLLLCGEHYDPQTGTVTLSCEKFDERIYNKIYLSDTVDRLISEVRVGSP